jgi:NAD(P)-dependent dehydrogenase (short-subunit alcohol dehydrogenase family)
MTTTTKVALVTGASSSIGEATARQLAAVGLTVYAAARRTERMQKLTQAGIHPIAMDVTNDTSMQAGVEAILNEQGRIDVLVNNAGRSPGYGGLGNVDEPYFDDVMALNLKGPFRLGVLVGTAMRAAGSGSIINVSSVASRRPEPHALPYAAAKAGLDAVTVGLAKAFAPTVRVNGIVPGPFRTDISAGWSSERRDYLESHTMLGRIGEPSEVVGAALYLASDASTFTTGTLLAVDGGSF